MHNKLPLIWNTIFEHDDVILFLEQTLKNYLPTCRWFGGKSRNIENITIFEHVIFETEFYNTYACILQCNYLDGLHEWYSLPITITNNQLTPSIIKLDDNHFLVDALQTEDFRKKLYLLMLNNDVNSQIQGYKNKKINLTSAENIQSKILNVEQSNTSVIYNDTYFFKWFRKIDVGINPDLETIKYLTEETEFKNIPTYLGHIQWQIKTDFSLLGMMQNAVQNEGDAWVYVCNELKQLYHTMLENPSKKINDLIGDTFYANIKLLGKRTAEMHNALSKGNTANGFNAEPFDISYQNWIYDCIEKLIDSKFKLLHDNLSKLNEETIAKAQIILTSKQKLKKYFKTQLLLPLLANKIRVHADYHLGQVLYSNNDFVILDFEGEPDKPHAMRRIKYTALRDVAGMMRSFHYATFAVLYQNFEAQQQKSLLISADEWYKNISNIYLESYLQSANDVVLPNTEILPILLQLYVAEKAIYEMGYEINNRPAWLSIPMESVYELVQKLN